MQPFSSQKYLPWKETVTVTSVRPNSADVVEVYASAGVYRMGVVEAAPSKGVYVRCDIRVTLGMELSFIPKPFDTVLWKGDTYTVLSVDGSDWQKFWAITARNLVLAADLRQTGTLSRPSATQDATKRPARATYAPVTSNVPCRVQPMGGTATDVMEKKTIPQRFTAFVGVLLDARANDKFTVSGVDYTVTASNNAERIDELQSLALEILLP